MGCVVPKPLQRSTACGLVPGTVRLGTQEGSLQSSGRLQENDEGAVGVVPQPRTSHHVEMIGAPTSVTLPLTTDRLALPGATLPEASLKTTIAMRLGWGDDVDPAASAASERDRTEPHPAQRGSSVALTDSSSDAFVDVRDDVAVANGQGNHNTEHDAGPRRCPQCPGSCGSACCCPCHTGMVMASPTPTTGTFTFEITRMNGDKLLEIQAPDSLVDDLKHWIFMGTGVEKCWQCLLLAVQGTFSYTMLDSQMFSELLHSPSTQDVDLYVQLINANFAEPLAPSSHVEEFDRPVWGSPSKISGPHVLIGGKWSCISQLRANLVIQSLGYQTNLDRAYSVFITSPQGDCEVAWR